MSHAEAFEYKQRVLLFTEYGDWWGTIMGVYEDGVFLVYHDDGDIRQYSLSETREMVENARAHEDPGTGTALSPGHCIECGENSASQPSEVGGKGERLCSDCAKKKHGPDE